MKPNELTEKKFIEIAALYRDCLGGTEVDSYIEHPGLLLPVIQDSRGWDSRILYDRWGSRWSEDTKIGFFVNQGGNLEITLYLNFDNLSKRVMAFARNRERTFIKQANALLVYKE